MKSPSSFPTFLKGPAKKRNFVDYLAVQKVPKKPEGPVLASAFPLKTIRPFGGSLTPMSHGKS